MAQSLSKLHTHIIFQVSSKSTIIFKEDSKQLYAYMGGIIKDNSSDPIIINGMSDHVHILCNMSKNIAFAKLVESVKTASSKWLKTQGKKYSTFQWQEGYAGFSVSPSVFEKTKQYIANQEKSHLLMSFKKEYRFFLNKYGVDYNEKYVWRD